MLNQFLRYSLIFSSLCFIYGTLTVVNALDIYVSQENGISNSSCWTGGLNMKCSSLALGLEGLQRHNSSTLWLESGNYSLSDREVLLENGNFKFVWMTDISIQSMTSSVYSPSNSNELPVTVQCQGDFGLSFVYATNVTLRRMRFVGCGVSQDTTSKIPDSSTFEKAIFTLYFLYCSSVTLQDIVIQDTNGTGMVMYGTIGNNEITNCSFISNDVEKDYNGGGGFYIEFPYCVPDQNSNNSDCSDSTNVPIRFTNNSIYRITSCSFLNNIARVKDDENSTFILPHNQTHLAFGRGGGLSVFYKGNCYNNIIHVSNCSFIGNIALWGGGLFVEHQDNSHDNSFILESSIFVNNEVLYHNSLTEGTGGGAVRLGYIFFDPAHAYNNSMKFIRVDFVNNRAYFGGGLSFYTPKEPEYATNVLYFENCTWTSNVARVGSAVDLALWHPTRYSVVMQTTFSNCTFLKNNGTYVHESGPYVVGVGAFYSDSIPVLFANFVKFESNQQSALAAIGTIISFASGCEAVFLNNSGINGGAIALMGMASMEVSNKTKLMFINNSAAVKGGAIFGESIGNHDLISSRNCFIIYHDLKVIPMKWSSTFLFEGNIANNKINSIYATSLLSCLWGGAYGSTTEAAKNVFCWNCNDSYPSQWIYSTNCSNEILTSPGKFNVTNSPQDACIRVFPGLTRLLPFSTEDDMKHNVTSLTVMTASIVSEVDQSKTYIDNSSFYISDNTVKLHGIPNNTVEIELKTTNHRVISYSFQVKFSECPLGMKFDQDASECKCEDNMYGSLVKCSYNQSKLLRGAWLGWSPHSKEYVAGLSPYTSALTKDQLYPLPKNYEVDMCKHLNRTGVLCGHCLPNYGPLISGGSKCIGCPNSKAKYNWVFYFLTEFFPIFIFFLIVVLFNISTTSGAANSFVFFSQVLTTVCKIDGDGTIQLNNITTHADILKDLYVIPYDIWNQKFFQPLIPEYCISPNITSLQVITAGYITAFFPLLLVISFSLLVWAYGQGLRPIVCLCRPLHRFFFRFKRIWNLQNSTIHALATFIIVSYTNFTSVSFLLLTRVPLFSDSSSVSNVLYYDGTIEYLGPKHVPYLIASVLVLCTFVAVPPILLIGPSIILLMKYIVQKFYRTFQIPSFFVPGPLFSQFLNAFHGCYKDGTGGENGNIDCRWFAGLYFLLRVLVYLISALSPYWYFQYLVQQLVYLTTLFMVIILQPYKRKLFNVVDSAVFIILGAISSLSMYNYYLTKLEERLSSWAFAVQYILIFIPLIYICLYSVTQVTKMLHHHRRREYVSLAATNIDDNFLEYVFRPHPEQLELDS